MTNKTDKLVKHPFYTLTYLQSLFPNRRFPTVQNVSDKKIKIFVFQHHDGKLPRYFNNTSIYTPLFCGKSLNPAIFSGICDNTGENISSYNAYLNELTGIYWIAKHYNEIDNPDYIGFAHYRRSLDWDPKKLKPNVVFANYYASLSTVGNMLRKFHTPFAVDHFLPIFKKTFGAEYDDIDKFFWRNHSFYICNIFITDKNTFFRYFDFLEKCINITISLIDSHRSELDKMGNYQKRAFGFLLERLTGYWLWHEKRQKRVKIIASCLRRYAIEDK